MTRKLLIFTIPLALASGCQIQERAFIDAGPVPMDANGDVPSDAPSDVPSDAPLGARLSANLADTDFGQVEVDVQSATMVWNITNTGDVPSSIPILDQTTTELQVSGNTCTGAIPAGKNCSMVVGFKPSAGGARSGALTLSITGSSVMLSATTTGMWRVTVQRFGTSGTITSNPAGITCTPPAMSCSGLFAPGTIVLQARTTNGTGVYFGTWSGTSAGKCANTPDRDCMLFVNGTGDITATFKAITANLVFVSSVSYPANLGGTGPYDTMCNQHASAAGINNATSTNFIAWISDSQSTARSRLGTASGWIRMDGRAFAVTQTSLLGRAILNPVRYSETGASRGDQWVSTGTAFDGSNNGYNCNDWTSTSGNSPLGVGNSYSGPGAWTFDVTTSCSYAEALLCMMRQFTAGTTAATFPGKRVWLSNNPYIVSTGNSPDTVCTADRPGGVTTGRALISRTTSTAASLLNAAQMYVRPDGQEVGTGAEIIARNLRGGIWQLGNSSYPTSLAYAWAGSSGVNLLGTAVSTCGDWTNPNQGAGAIGYGNYAGWGFFSGNTEPCNAGYVSLYCYEP